MMDRENEINALNQTITQQENRIDILIQEMQEAVQILANLKQQRDNLQTERNAIQVERDNLRADLTNAQTQNTRLNNELNTT